MYSESPNDHAKTAIAIIAPGVVDVAIAERYRTPPPYAEYERNLSAKSRSLSPIPTAIRKHPESEERQGGYYMP
jgi:hypothetical protein